MKIAHFRAESSQLSNMVSLFADALSGKAIFAPRSPGGAYQSAADASQPELPVAAVAAPDHAGRFDWLDRWFWRQTQREREAWLGESGDLFELEDRLRTLERRVGGRYY